LGLNGFNYIKKNHRWDALTDKLIFMFNEIIIKNNSNRT